MLCPIKVISNTIELIIHTSFYYVSVLLCVTIMRSLISVCRNCEVPVSFVSSQSVILNPSIAEPYPDPEAVDIPICHRASLEITKK